MSPYILGLAATTTLYAAVLSTNIGKEWTLENTWTTVVVGVGIVLGWLWLEDSALAIKAGVHFAIGGTPLVIRSLVLQFLRNRRNIRYMMGDKNGL